MSAPTGILSVVQDRMLAMLREVLRPAFSLLTSAAGGGSAKSSALRRLVI